MPEKPNNLCPERYYEPSLAELIRLPGFQIIGREVLKTQGPNWSILHGTLLAATNQTTKPMNAHFRHPENYPTNS